MSEHVIELNDSNFDQTVASSPALLVDFWAPWCGPCKMIGPILEELAGEFAGKLTIAKVNLDENPLSPTRFGVRSIPTLLLFKGGQVVATKVGAVPKQALHLWLSENI